MMLTLAHGVEVLMGQKKARLARDRDHGLRNFLFRRPFSSLWASKSGSLLLRWAFEMLGR
jgi:hypothetical protein